MNEHQPFKCPQMVSRHTIKIFQQMLQDFKSVSDQFRTFCIKRLKSRQGLAQTIPSLTP